MFKILFSAFVLVPLVELYVLIQVGSQLGALSTILLCLFTAALGAFLLRLQGIGTVERVRSRLREGQMPATDVIEAFILVISGALLLTPGFLTDIVGFLCLLPRLRTNIAMALLSRMAVRYRATRTQENGNIVVEGEYWQTEEKVYPLDHDNRRD